MPRAASDILDPDDCRASQAFTRTPRAEGAGGIVCDSVRQGPHVAFAWDGAAMVAWYEKSAVRNL